MLEHDPLAVAESIARRRGYQCARLQSKLRIRHTEVPVYLEVVPKGSLVLVVLSHEGIRDYIEDLIDSGEDARDIIESALDDLSGLAIELSEVLRRQGFRVELRLRDAAMDVLEILEELEEA